MITENDKFEIPDKYKKMTLKEIRKEKDILFHKLKEDQLIAMENNYTDPNVCDDCEIGDSLKCQFCCSRCYEVYDECPNPDCDPMDI